MDFKFFLIFVVGSFLSCLHDIFFTNRISEQCAKKCNYNCDKCENWKCYYHYCKKKREEL